MQASEDKSWERFIDKAMQEARPEEPTGGFTEKVMAALEAQQETAAVTRYKAPISKLTWVVLGVILAAVFVWTSFAGMSTQWDFTSKLSSLMNFTDVFEGVALPSLKNSSLYSIGLFALFVLLQVVFMKRNYDRRLGLE